MIRIVFCCVVSILLSWTSVFAGSAQLVLDARTGEILASENADELNHPASLTKMMTVYMAFEAIRSGRLAWDDALDVSKHAASRPPTKLRVRAGEKITVREAVLGMIVQSANDAAAVLAEELGGTEENFGVMMTQRAHQLGMTNTLFFNASGLPDERQVTTARDMSALAVALMRDFPQEYALFATRSFAFRGRTINGHNNLMYRFKGMDGIKTGYTNASGYNLVSSAMDGGRRVVGVVMGGGSAAGRDNLMSRLINANMAKATPGNALVASKAPESQEIVAMATPLAPAIPRPRRIVAAGTVVSLDTPFPVSMPGSAAIPERIRRTEDESWQIQIAAAPTAAGALDTLYAARSTVGGPLLRRNIYTKSVTDNDVTMYKARFTGFSDEADAASACQQLVENHYECTIVPGQGG